MPPAAGSHEEPVEQANGLVWKTFGSTSIILSILQLGKGEGPGKPE